MSSGAEDFLQSAVIREIARFTRSKTGAIALGNKQLVQMDNQPAGK